MKVNSAQNNGLSVHNICRSPIFGSEPGMLSKPQEADRFEKENKKSNKGLWAAVILGAAGIGALIIHKTYGWKILSRKKDKLVFSETFKNISEAKKYFENLGIEYDARGISDNHLSMLNRIKAEIEQLKNMGIKIDKPDSITISDWKNREETKQLFAKHGSTQSEPPESGYYQAFCCHGGNKNHLLIDSNVKDFSHFRHEMGHANHHFGFDSYWNSKGMNGTEFGDNQLKILGSEEKLAKVNDTYGRGRFGNIIEFSLPETPTRFRFINKNGEARYVYIQDMVAKMQKETNCYKPDDISEQVAYIFEGLLENKKFSDEAMLYYDFAGGPRIPNLKINDKTYDEYIESLYNNTDLINKLKENIRIFRI